MSQLENFTTPLAEVMARRDMGYQDVANALAGLGYHVSRQSVYAWARGKTKPAVKYHVALLQVFPELEWGDIVDPTGADRRRALQSAAQVQSPRTTRRRRPKAA